MDIPPGKSPQINVIRIIAFFFAGIAAIYVVSRILQCVRGWGGPAPDIGGGFFEYLPPVHRALFTLVVWGLTILAACVLARILKRK